MQRTYDYKLEMPDWLHEGNTYLIPKVKIPSGPKDFRPITCLNTRYKLFTKCITEMIQDLKSKNWIANTQFGSKRGSLGAKEVVLANMAILNRSKKFNKTTLFFVTL